MSFEKVNTHQSTTAFDYTRLGMRDVTKRLIQLERHPAIRVSFEKKFSFLFEKLAVANTREIVARYVRPAHAAALVGAAAGPRDGYVRDDEAGD